MAIYVISLKGNSLISLREIKQGSSCIPTRLSVQAEGVRLKGKYVCIIMGLKKTDIKSCD